MKVSLLTFHKALNYGAMMQTFATYKTIEKMGHEVELVDLRIPEQKSFLSLVFVQIRRFFANRFVRKYYPNLSANYSCLEDLRATPPEADYYVVGSDQVWNTSITRENYLAFFLDFGDLKIPRFAFSSSFSTEKIEVFDQQKENIKRCLSNFTGIAVREESGKRICESLLPISRGIDVEIVLDPTFLLGKEYYDIIGNVTLKNQILVYKLFDDTSFNQLALSIGKCFKMPLLNVGRIMPIRGFKYLFPASPSK